MLIWFHQASIDAGTLAFWVRGGAGIGLLLGLVIATTNARTTLANALGERVLVDPTPFEAAAWATFRDWLAEGGHHGGGGGGAGGHGRPVAASGKKTALCSNLVAAYVEPCKAALPGPMDAHLVAPHGRGQARSGHLPGRGRGLNLPPKAILFVGDRQLEDVDGTRSVGMHSMLVDRFALFCGHARD